MKRLCLPRTDGHHHTKRRFVFVEKTSIARERPDRTATKAQKNTRKLHCITGIQPYVLSVRERSCFCAGCRGDGPCLHTDPTGPLSVCKMLVVAPGNARRHQPPVDQAPPPPPPPVDDQAPLPHQWMTRLPHPQQWMTRLPHPHQWMTRLPDSHQWTTRLPHPHQWMTRHP